jgi:4'-phosphopantetheinyl transferase EntD
MSATNLAGYFADLRPREIWGPAFVEALPYGVSAGVFLPESPDPVPAAQIGLLEAPEGDYASNLRGFRQVSFVGGRQALHRACAQFGERVGAILVGPRGEPALPAGLTGSISHKRSLAVAIVARAEHGSVGLDLEDLGPPRQGIAERVLRPEELEFVRSLPESRQWTATVLRFSLKEAIYKAIHPFVQRFVSFEEACVVPDVDGTAEVILHLDRGEGPFIVEATYFWLPGQVLSTVRIQPAPGDPAR